MNGYSATLRSTLAAFFSLSLLASLVILSPVKADAVSGTANVYQVATVVGGVPDTSGLSAGDCALVIQMTGSIADGLGVYEILDPANSAPTRTYSATEAVQFVVLPGGCDSAQTVDAGGVQATPWNGATGGVIFLGGTTLTMADSIDASGAGYSQANAPTVNNGEDGETDDTSPTQPSNRAFSSGGGGGGVIGGGGGGASPNWSLWRDDNSDAGLGGTLAAGGVGGLTITGAPEGGTGGDPGAPGNGGSSAEFILTEVDKHKVGAGGAGGGSYGGGGAACGSNSSAAYSASGGGGASWTGGGIGGLGGTNQGLGTVNPAGTPGEDNLGVAIPLGSGHYLHEGDARLMMGGAGGDDRNAQGSGNGGGIVVLTFDSISGGSNNIVANGDTGISPVLGPIAGAGGGAGGQMLIQSPSVSDVTVAANGAAGASNTIGIDHVGSAGAGGGAGAIWFDGAGADATNTGANDGAVSPDSLLAPVGLSNVEWSVAGGSAGITTIAQAVGGVLYSVTEWNSLLALAHAETNATGNPLSQSLAAVTGLSEADILAVFPDIDRPDNPKNAGLGCTAGGGGNGLVRVSPPEVPEIVVEKATNGIDSDDPSGATLVPGSTVVWTYVVEITGGGDAENVTVADNQVADSDIECDIDGDGIFTDTNVIGTVTPPKTIICQATGVVGTGDYSNTVTVTGDYDGDPLEPATDPSHYTTADPSITVEKQTNGVEADTDTLNDGTESAASTSTGGTNPVPVGSAVVWTFQFSNDGAIPLTNVQLSDATTTANGQPGATTITCDWAASSDATTAVGNLSVGETVSCTATGSAGAGLHENTATVTGDAAGTQSIDTNGDPIYDVDGNPVFVPNPDGTFDPVLSATGDPIVVSDADASGYDGAPPSIDIVKTVTGTADGDTADVVEGQAVAWTFVVTNDGAGTLNNVVITDPVLTNMGVAITCDWATSSDAATAVGTLSSGETVTCSASSAASAADLTNTATVTGDPAGGGPEVESEDPADYAVGVPAIDIVKTTCSNVTNVPGSCSDGLTVGVGDPIVWLYELENTGEVTLVDIELGDDIETGVTAAACDWANSSDPTTGSNILSVGETVSCSYAGTAGAGDYDNIGEVTGVPGAPDGTPYLDPSGDPLDEETATDPSDYFGLSQPAIIIEKDTNGIQADTGTGPLIAVGDAVTWTFVVTNNGNVDLADVIVTDVVTTDNGTVADPAGVVCDWANSSDAATPARNLSVNETVTCTSSSTAVAGQYANASDVVGTPVADATTADPDAPVVLLDNDGVPLDDVVDDDPSAYFGPVASIDIEKDTNGNQADVLADQDLLAIGDAVTWTFVVENTGNVDLADVIVTDVVTTDNGTVADPAGVVCDWATSSDAATPARNLSVGETVTCTSTSTAAAGQYANASDVVGTPVADATTADPDAPVALVDENGDALDDVIDDDPSHYYGEPVPAIDIEKDTNGNQADVLADQDLIALGDAVTWTFVVENTGNVDLADVIVTDVVTTDNGTVADPAGVVCDWANSSDPATPARNLSVGETVTCTSVSTAAGGQYANASDVVGTPVSDATTADPDAPVALVDVDGAPLDDVVDDDPSHYYGIVTPVIDIEKDTNGIQADTLGEEPLVYEGDVVTWTFDVTNTGNVALGNVTVTDTVTTDNGTAADPAGVVCDWANSSDATTPADILSVNETVTCTAASAAEAGLYRNLSNVVGTPLASDGTPLLGDDGVPFPNVTDTDPSGYFGPNASIDIEKDTNSNQADVVADQDILAIGDAVTWTFVVTNDGNVDLANVIVTDVVTTDNGTTADPDGVVCDWANSSNPITPARNLAVNETVECTSASTAAAGQYANVSDVVGTPVDDAVTADPDAPVVLVDENGGALDDVIDADPSHYYGDPVPAIDIEKDTNGNQADGVVGQDAVPIGAVVTWTFVVENTGNVDLADVIVTDTVTTDNGTVADPAGVVCDWANSSDPATPARNLSVGETVGCTSSSLAEAGQYANLSDVVGTPVADATTADPDAPVALLDIDGAPVDDVVDDDPSHYFGDAIPGIKIEKDTNGVQADTGGGPLVTAGEEVTWTFVVTNIGTSLLATALLTDVIVTDTVTTDNGTAPDPDGVVCDWANSSDDSTPAGILSRNETVTCTSSSTAAAGQYGNVADVVGTPVAFDGTPLLDPDGEPYDDVTDDDPSAYFGPNASIDIEKDTNGTQADVLADQDVLAIGDIVTWTFVVHNDGNIDLANVGVTDTVTTDNGTLVDHAGVSCDWANSSDPATPARNLSVGETVTCTSVSIAEAGQYANVADVVGTPVADATTADPVDPTPILDEDGEPLGDVVDDDPSHYYGEPDPEIDIEKDTNGNQADVQDDQDTLGIGAPVTWTFEVQNTGNVDLADVIVTDTVTTDNGTIADPAGVVCDWASSSDPATPARNLSVGETVTCTSVSTAAAGQYGNLAEIVGTPVADATTADPDAPVALLDIDGAPLDDVIDEDPSHYFGDSGPRIDIEKDTNGVQADTGTGPLVLAGNVVTWTFEVQNTGDVTLGDVTVTDTVTNDNGTITGAVSCDWANSSDPATSAAILSPLETVTCTAVSSAELGQYNNTADVVGTPLAFDGTPLLGVDGLPVDDVEDLDSSGYFGPAPAIDIEKDTNGNQADVIGDQDSYVLGDAIVWTFEVENSGNTDLANVTVTDVATTDNGTVADPAGVVCDWANSSDPATPDRNLSIGETVTCTSASSAEVGQYANNSGVVGTPVDDAVTADPFLPIPLVDETGTPLTEVSDTDPSHYFGEAQPAIGVEKDTNGNQADLIVDQHNIAIGDDVTWTFVVTNTGDVDLADIVIADTVTTDNGTVVDPAGVVCDWDGSSNESTPARNLASGETVTCTSSSTAQAGQYANLADVIGTPVADATTADPDNPEALVGIDGEPLGDVDDEDPSHYFGAESSITIEKDTNGNQADVVTAQDHIAVGDDVVWTFVVTNSGNVDLAAITVTDTVTTDNGTAVDPDGVVCDWDNSSDVGTPAGNLSIDEYVTCTSVSSAAAGQYANNAAVIGTPVEDAETADPINPEHLIGADGEPISQPTDEDPSHYFGAVPSIAIEKDTNGNQADVVSAQGPIAVGDDVVWTFVVTNTGNVALGDVTVTDTTTIDNGTALGPVTCDWAASTDGSTPAASLSVGESVTCTSASSAEAGQYGNVADVVGTPIGDPTSDNPEPLLDDSGEPLDDASDDDPSHYFGGSLPAIDIEKDTNGNQADVSGDQDYLAVGSNVVWTFVVTNTGDSDLADVVVTDSVTIDNGTAADPDGVVCDWDNSSDAATPARNLSVGETVSCTSSSQATAGQYANNGQVSGTPVLDATSADPDAPVALKAADGTDLSDVTDEDLSHYFGPVFDLALRKQLADGTNDVGVAIDDEVTFIVTVFNQGNVSATDIELVDYLPDGLELVGDDWVEGADGIFYDLGDLVLEPGESTTVTLQVRVAERPAGNAFELVAEISDGDAVDAQGVVIGVASASGELVALEDIDSTPDATNDETPVEDVIDNAEGDEDDHDRVGLIFLSTATPQQPTTSSQSGPIPSGFATTSTDPAPTTPAVPVVETTPLAYTGSDTLLLASLSSFMMLVGGCAMIAGRRRRDDFAMNVG